MFWDSWTTELHMQSLDKQKKYESYKNNRVTIKEYADMPKVLIDGRVFVDREVFIGYALNLLQQELDTAMSDNEDIGLRVAMSVIKNIR